VGDVRSTTRKNNAPHTNHANARYRDILWLLLRLVEKEHPDHLSGPGEYGGTSGSFAIFIMIYPPTYTISIPQLLIPAIAIPAMITGRYTMLAEANGRRVTIIWK
jgi:hypothetical protein